jgi:hypothetical protein
LQRGFPLLSNLDLQHAAKVGKQNKMCHGSTLVQVAVYKDSQPPNEFYYGYQTIGKLYIKQ